MPDVEIDRKITPLLMFEGEAEAAMTFYTSLFDESSITSIQRYDADGAGAEGTVERATFTLAGSSFMAIDSSEEHAFGFTPSISLFVDCDSADEVTDRFEALSEAGEVLMPLDSYPFSERFGWVEDRYGVSWQLNLD